MTEYIECTNVPAASKYNNNNNNNNNNKGKGEGTICPRKNNEGPDGKNREIALLFL